MIEGVTPLPTSVHGFCLHFSADFEVARQCTVGWAAVKLEECALAQHLQEAVYFGCRKSKGYGIYWCKKPMLFTKIAAF